ncbi:MAG TPA: tetrahydrofolate dehydrogenase/cyclohydrolase catalytic domain-containing protein, partial [Geothrix sp.]|nr:tetrahydrofolate dehydrogenase/cyclohydrolase catalytic domain-containing protein [Geothrix sp.]
EDLGINAADLRVENGMQLVKLLARLNQDDKTHGVFIFYPLRYPEIKDDEVMDLVDPGKDIEGLHAINIGFLTKYRKRLDDGSQHRCMTPCTARAIVKTLKRGFGDGWMAGKTVLVINDSLRIGRPLTAMVANLKGTPILCHAATNPTHLEGFVRMADVIVSAVPAPGYQIRTDWIKDGALCFDLSGDGNFDYEALDRRGILYTDTTKNSVGKVTRAMALLNLTYAAGVE